MRTVSSRSEAQAEQLEHTGSDVRTRCVLCDGCRVIKAQITRVCVVCECGESQSSDQLAVVTVMSAQVCACPHDLMCVLSMC